MSLLILFQSWGGTLPVAIAGKAATGSRFLANSASSTAILGRAATTSRLRSDFASSTAILGRTAVISHSQSDFTAISRIFLTVSGSEVWDKFLFDGVSNIYNTQRRTE